MAEASAECVKVAVRCRPMNSKETERGMFLKVWPAIWMAMKNDLLLNPI